MTADPRVRDFTEATPRALRVEVDPSPAYELLFQLFALDNPKDSTEYAGGSEWLDQTRGRLPKEFLDDLAALNTGGEIWLVLLGLVYDTPAPKTIEAFLEYLTSMDPAQLQSHLISKAWFTKERGIPQQLIDDAAGGDAAAYDTICAAAEECECGPGWFELLSHPAAEIKDILVDIIRRYADKAFDGDVSKLLDRDARAKRVLAATLPAAELVERSTNGITFRNLEGVEAVILVPSVVIRPFVVITDHGPLRIFGYPVADENLTADEDAPPSWLVDFYKAVGDDKRLRILTILTEGDTTLGALVERLDLSKSTVHHHLRLLRTAGLVRVTIGDEHTYSLRTDAVAQGGPLLEAYLHEHTNRE